MAFFENSYVQIFFSSVVVYLFIIVLFRILGKREFSQLSVVDLVFVLLISNSVQNAMVGSNDTLAGGLVAAGSLFLVNFIFERLLYKFPKFNRIVRGTTLMLIYDGKLNLQNMKKAKITRDEMMEVLREHGIAKVEEVNLAVLEVDGNISLLTDDFKQKSTTESKSDVSSGKKNNS
ncbi:MAG: YetF domain-containing protein [Clostridiaceae bacterium]